MPRRHPVAARLRIRLPPELETDRRPWRTVVMSRLGRNLLARRVELAMLHRFVEQAISDQQAVLAVVGTAAHPWLKRSCELLAAPLVEVELAAAGDAKIPPVSAHSTSQHTLRLVWQASEATEPPTRDELAVQLADYVDATWVRPGGTIHHLLRQRLAAGAAADVRVLISRPQGKQAATAASGVVSELLAAGAVGYCCRAGFDTSEVPLEQHHTTPRLPVAANPAALAALVHAPHRWLIHCTRAPCGAWPGQSDQQFRDGLLLSSPRAADPTPLTTLQRILTQRQLVGTSRTIVGRQAVVCFSALPLLAVMARRQFRAHLGRWDAEPYGLAIDLEAARRLGAQPVIYCDEDAEVVPLPPEERWRRQSRGRTFDWSAEREWRLPGTADLRLLQHSELIAFVKNDDEIERLPQTPWPVISIQSLRRFAGEGVASEPTLR